MSVMAHRPRRPAMSKRRSSRVTVAAPAAPSRETEENTRAKTTEVLAAALRESEKAVGIDVDEMAKEIEQEIYKTCGANIGTGYKISMRAHLMTLKNKKNDLRERMLAGEVKPAEFAHMSSQEMTSREQKAQDEKLQEKNLQMAILHPEDGPATILEIKAKDGRDREKWGVGSSAAAIDYFESFDHDDENEEEGQQENESEAVDQ
ncbi:transcription factor S-II, central domain-containing protein [Myxozyma melibiosi]|uniref:Transcription factor S-II, central domain-containing protein n=1 Tax=Myxozyma melibiosi TaxID=54550 RepID=A0ABR1F724_9ASCO